MKSDLNDYDLFLKFLETYSPKGFLGINSDDALMQELESRMKGNKQFIYVADAIQMKILFTSNGSSRMIDILPEDLSLYHFMEATHTDDIQRLSLGRAKVIKIAQDLFIAEKGYSILSTNIKIRNAKGGYTDFLIQGYLYFATIPYKTVYFLKIHTDISWHKKIRFGYHYYTGNDLYYFRYPDDEMLNMGNIFSGREFEIIKLIGSGLGSEEIADKLFISLHTVNTHRRNVLEKSEKASIAELIYDLKERGVL